MRGGTNSEIRQLAGGERVVGARYTCALHATRAVASGNDRLESVREPVTPGMSITMAAAVGFVAGSVDTGGSGDHLFSACY